MVAGKDWYSFDDKRKKKDERNGKTEKKFMLIKRLIGFILLSFKIHFLHC